MGKRLRLPVGRGRSAGKHGRVFRRSAPDRERGYVGRENDPVPVLRGSPAHQVGVVDRGDITVDLSLRMYT